MRVLRLIEKLSWQNTRIFHGTNGRIDTSTLAYSNLLTYALRVIFLHFKPLSLFPLAFALAVASCSDSTKSSPADSGAAAPAQSDPANKGTAVLTAALADPGVDLWLGDESAGLDREPMIEKFPLYAIHHDRYAVSGGNLSHLRKQRDAVIASIKERIGATAKTAMALPSAETEIPAMEAELAIALDLNAVEILDLLTGTTMQLHTFLQNFENGKLETYLATSHARLHRNLLGAISGILKQEGFAPVVNEEWESNFTFEKAQSDSAFNLLEELPFAEETVPDIPVGGLAPFTTTFSQSLIDWAQAYLRDTPTAQRKEALGMETPVPALR